jgi:hypothetical protein
MPSRWGVTRRRLVAAAVLSPALLAIVPASAQVAPGLPTPPPVPVPSGPPVHVPNPIVPPPGQQPGIPAHACTHTPLGPTEIRTVYASLTDSHSSSPLQPASTFAIDPAMPCRIYRTLSDSVQRSDDGGKSWVAAFTDPGLQTTPQRPSVLSPVVPAGGSTIYVYDMQGGNGVYASTDAGQSWGNRDTNLFTPGLQGPTGPTGGITAFAVAPRDPNTLYLVGSANGQTLVYASNDGGASWRLAGQPSIPEVTSIAVEPNNARHVYAAAGGPETTGAAATSGQRQFFESVDGGQNWVARNGPGGMPSPSAVWATDAGGVQRVYVRTALLDKNSGAIAGQEFWRSDNGAQFQYVSTPSNLGTNAELTFNPNRPDDMVIAASAPDGKGLVVFGSLDGFNSTRYNRVFPRGAKVTAVEARADQSGDMFVQDTFGGNDELIEFDVTALATSDSGNQSFQISLKVCSLAPAQGTYKAGSIAFDGVYLDYTQDDLAPGTIFRVNPLDCKLGQPIHMTPAVALYALTFDGEYQFASGHVGALLARGPAAGYAPVYAVDPVDGTTEQAGAIWCGAAHDPTCQQDANVFTFDPYLHQLWAPVNDPDYGMRDSLVSVVPHSTAPLPQHPSCMTTFATSPENRMSSWVAGAQDVLYVQLEDDITVDRVDSKNCRLLDSFTHRHFSEGPADGHEDDQMACDALTFGEGAPRVPPGTGTSALWIRDVVDNTVHAYAIPTGSCPFPTRLAVKAVPPVQVTAGFTVCATLTSVTTDLPLYIPGMPVQFSLAGAPIGTGITKDDGSACVPGTAPAAAGSLPLRADFAGSAAHMASAATATLLVSAPSAGSSTGPCANDCSVSNSGKAPPFPHAPPGPVALQLPVQPLPQVQTQAQAQAQPQAQPQAQSQPATMAQRRTQARVALQGSDGARHEVELQASSTRVALVAQGAGLALFAAGLWARSAQLRRRRPTLARARSNRR